LDDCDAAMTAAGAQLWDQQRDLALQLNKLAARCRVEIKDMQPNERTQARRAPEQQQGQRRNPASPEVTG